MGGRRGREPPQAFAPPPAPNPLTMAMAERPERPAQTAALVLARPTDAFL